MHAQADIGGDHGRANVEGSAFAVGDPVLIHVNQLLQAFQGSLLVQGRHAHTLGAAAHAGEIVRRAEELEAAVSAAIALHSFENGLAVMQDHRSRIHGEVTVGNDAGVMPAHTGFIVHEEHMVGKDPAETKGGFIRRLFLKMIGKGHFDIQHAKAFFLKIKFPDIIHLFQENCILFLYFTRYISSRISARGMGKVRSPASTGAAMPGWR